MDSQLVAPSTSKAFQDGGEALGNAAAAEIFSDWKYDSLVANVSGVVWSAALHGRTSFVSAKVKQVCGYSAAEILAAPGNIWLDRIHPDDAPRVRQIYEEFVTTKTTFDAEYRWQHQDGSWIWLRSRAVIRLGSYPEVVDGILTEITGQKTLEAQVQHLQKMATVGQFAGGIAHDFNNLLAVILGNDNFLIDALPEGDPRRADAEAIFEAAERAAALTAQLLTVSRGHAFAPKIFSVNAVVEGVEKMLRRVLREDIDFSIALGPVAGNVCADAGQIEHVILNLVVNARDAMPEGGTLTIKTTHVDAGTGGTIRDAVDARGAYAVITVSDTGCGMDADTRRRIFEPFFTTKEQGKGTGLGLSTCQTILQQVGGFVRADSTPGRGSVFTVYLPCVNLAAAPVRLRAGATRPAAGSETVLLVEDDDRLRIMVQRILERLGYRVLAARDGRDALALSQAHEGELDLILSDVVIPDLNGVEIAKRVQHRFRNASALFMSGHSSQALLQAGTLRSDAHFLQKPFMPEALARTVREVLDDTPAASGEHARP